MSYLIIMNPEGGTMSKTIKNSKPKLDFCDVLIEPALGNVFSRSLVNLNIFCDIENCTHNVGIPIIAANMDSVGTMSMARVLCQYDCWTALHKHYTMDNLIKFFSEENPITLNRTFYSLGITDEDIEKYDQVCKYSKKLVQHVCIDIANGYTKKFIDKIKKIKEINPTALIMAGNVVTPSGTVALIKAGVQIVKIGIGGGAACKTRSVTGIGYPQFSAVLECGQAAEDHNGMICSDGGCSSSGDIAKAFAAGSNWVMLGNMLAGHEESEMQCINGEYDFYGMSSDKAMNKYSHKHIYRASEGHELKIKAKGSVSSTIQEIMGGLRSACTYVGAKNLGELYYKSNFILVNRGK